MDCKKAVNLYEEGDEEQKEAALDHFVSCPECQRNFRSLVLAIQGQNPIPCAECRERLPAYLVANTWARAKSNYWLEVSQHLHVCPDCLRECLKLEVYIEKIRKEKKRKKGSRK